MTHEPTAAANSKPKRRWYQFSLRTLMLLVIPVACVAAWIGSEYRHGKNQYAAIGWVEKQGGFLQYDEAATKNDWRRQWLGEWYPTRVSHVDLGTRELETIGPLAALTELEVLLLDNTNIHDIGPLIELPALQLLDLSHTNTTLADIEKLQQLNADLIVVHEDISHDRPRRYRVRAGYLTCTSPEKETLWTAEMPKGFPQSVLYETQIVGEQVVASNNFLFVVCEAATGKQLWHCKKTSRFLAANQRVLLALSFVSRSQAQSEGFTLFGYDLLTGQELFWEHMPGEVSTNRRRSPSDLFLVTSHGLNCTFALVLNEQGQVLARLEEHRDGQSNLSGRSIIRWQPGQPSGATLLARDEQQQEMWRRKDCPSLFNSAVSCLEMPAGNLLFYSYAPRTGGQVDLVCLDPATGNILWETSCVPATLGQWMGTHDVFLERRENSLFVLSRYNVGAFVEQFDTATGQREHQWLFEARPAAETP